jgi:uncharacterized protein YndB with AHSA1/START domain
MNDMPTYRLQRTFNAARELVWKTWTDPELLARWYGPNVESIIHGLVRPGGAWLTEMKMGEQSFFQKADYIEVVAPELIVCLMSNTDANWEVAPNPRMPDWPRQLMTTVRFDVVDGETKVDLTWVPHEATDAEIACFAEAIDRAGAGWTAGMDKLEALLAEL